ncbi:helix-turn-helix domain-containing protein [Desulfurobacterium indicum]|uniref:helix-turn-helix domain-containing protein n=1 Tax=Desulfurobacterium indicum TaxID=1914305 RepID=UPI001FE8C7EC|nr:helix-turn-helix domain-containing protein [Desulfurobacterium indicum]
MFRLKSIEEQLKEYPDFLTFNQVAEILQVSERTMYRLIKGAQIEAVKVRGVWRIPKMALVEYLQEHNCLNVD